MATGSVKCLLCLYYNANIIIFPWISKSFRHKNQVVQCCAVDIPKILGGMSDSPYLCNVIQKHRPQAPYPPKGAAVRNISASRSRHEGFTKGCRRVRGRKVCTNLIRSEKVKSDKSILLCSLIASKTQRAEDFLEKVIFWEHEFPRICHKLSWILTLNFS